MAIVTDASTHRRLAGMALEAGKHVLVEKPLTTTSKDASELIDLAERGGRTLMVGHTFLYNPGVRAVKEYLDAGEVGEVYYLYSQRTSLGPIRSDVNAIWDLAPHDIAILDYLLDQTPAWVSAVGANPVRQQLGRCRVHHTRISGRHCWAHSRQLGGSEQGPPGRRRRQ